MRRFQVPPAIKQDKPPCAQMEENGVENDLFLREKEQR
jgi:hypothetical protein